MLKLWRLRNLTVQGKITIFKTLALSKIIHMALVKVIPTSTIDLLNKIQKQFIWNNLKPKIKQSTLCNNYQDGALKNVNINVKIVSLQCSWIKRRFDDNMHNWKKIPLALIHNNLGQNFKFHSNLQMEKKILNRFPKYYQEIINGWSKKLFSIPC